MSLAEEQIRTKGHEGNLQAHKRSRSGDIALEKGRKTDHKDDPHRPRRRNTEGDLPDLLATMPHVDAVSIGGIGPVVVEVSGPATDLSSI